MKLVLLRHGESIWNKENRFTGWTDVDLSDQGRQEARGAGQALKRAGFSFDLAFTSVLKRAIKTLWYVLDELDQPWLPVEKAWQLNERHYGALQGLDKAKTAARHGEDQVRIWRRSYDVTPPPLTSTDPRWPGHERVYAGLARDQLPLTESLADTIKRILPYWESSIAPQIRLKRKLIIVAHGNSLRGLAMHLDQLTEQEVLELDIPTGQPLVYELDEELRPLKSYYLA